MIDLMELLKKSLTIYALFQLLYKQLIKIVSFIFFKGQVYVVYTPANYFGEHDFFWLSTPHKRTFLFDVIACNDAVISLLNGTEFTHEIVLGAQQNTKTIIRPLVGSGSTVEADTVEVLSCTEKRSFWIQMIQNRLTVGSGQLHEIQLIETTLVNLTLQAVALSTRGVQGEWTLSQSAG